MALDISKELVHTVSDDIEFQFRNKYSLNNYIQFCCPFGKDGKWNGVDVHFEYTRNHLWLHIENGKESDRILVRELLKSKINDKDFTWFKDGCRYYRAITDIESLKSGLLHFHQRFDGALSSLIDPEAKIENIHSLIQRNLTIPLYQRPYCWKKENVQQLLEDINEARKSYVSGQSSNYRIGSVILHPTVENGELVFEIVDGQQRITTIALILYACLDFENYPVLENFQYSGSEAIFHIRENWEYIKLWLTDSDISNSVFSDFLLTKCDAVLIEVKELSEAFQMFDSQNGRGKPLEAYNLLKAYHIGSMTQDAIDEKEQKYCDRRWEDAVAFYDSAEKKHKDLLLQLFNHQLFRSREWCRGEWAEYFDNSKISEFKGTSIKKADYPFQNTLILLALLKKNSQGESKKRLRDNADPMDMSPYASISQDIINGREFFDFVETYVQMYRLLFVENNTDIGTAEFKQFKSFYKSHCKYPDSYHTGESYIREIYKSLIVVLFDKFGEEGLLKYYQDIYSIVYRERVIRYMVKPETADHLAFGTFSKRGSLFVRIVNAKRLSDLEELKREAKKPFAVNNPDKMSNPQKRQEVISYFIENNLILNYNG